MLPIVPGSSREALRGGVALLRDQRRQPFVTFGHSQKAAVEGLGIGSLIYRRRIPRGSTYRHDPNRIG